MKCYSTHTHTHTGSGFTSVWRRTAIWPTVSTCLLSVYLTGNPTYWHKVSGNPMFVPCFCNSVSDTSRQLFHGFFSGPEVIGLSLTSDRLIIFSWGSFCENKRWHWLVCSETMSWLFCMKSSRTLKRSWFPLRLQQCLILSSTPKIVFFSSVGENIKTNQVQIKTLETDGCAEKKTKIFF